MRSVRFGLAISFLLFSVSIRAQQAPTQQGPAQAAQLGSSQQGTPQTPDQAAQAVALIRQSLAAQSGGAAINDVTLSGTLTIMQGANKGSGTIAYTASAGGQSRATLTTPAGVQTTFRDFSASPRVGTSVGPDGVSKKSPMQNLMGPHPAAYFPALILASALSSSTYASADMGQETQDGATVRHVAIWPTFGKTAVVPTGALLQFGQHDLYLDPATLLPVALTFNLIGTNPDKNVKPFRKIDVYAPEEVRFSDYRQVQGRVVPFHILVYIHKTPVIEIQLSSVAINTGVVVAAN